MDNEHRSSAVPVTALLVSLAILVLGNGLQGTLLGVRAGLEGMAEESIGLFMSAFFAGHVVGSVLSPGLVSQIGHIRTFAALASVASAVALAHAIFVDPFVWAGLRAVHGACYAGLVLVAESWLNAATTSRYRGRVLSIYNVVVLGAWAASQPLLTLAPAEGFVLFCLVSMLLSIALVPVTVSRATAPGGVGATRLRLGRLYEISPLGVAGMFAVGLSMSAFWGMGPTYAQQIGLDEAGIAAFMGCTMLGCLALQWPLGLLSDRVDRRLVIVAAAALSALASVALAFGAAHGLATLIALAFAFGGFALPIYSLCIAHANDAIPEEDLLATASGLLLLYGVGAMLGPFLASLAMARVGSGGLYLYTGAVFVLFAAFGLYRMTQRPAVPATDKESFAALPRTTHVIHQMDERSGEPRESETDPE